MPASEAASASDGRALLLAQALALSRLSIRRIVNTKVFWSAIAMAAMPVILFGFIATMMWIHGDGQEFGGAHPGRVLEIMTNLFAGAYIHFGLFFSAFNFGVQATRDDIDDQTLHYLLLQPAPRWLFPAAKYVAFLAFAIPCFLVSLGAIHLLVALPLGWDAWRGTFLTGEGFVRIARLAMVVVAGLAVYGAVFLAVSSILRNAFYGIVLYGWELAISFLPPEVKNFSISYHLKGILPFSGTETARAVTVLSEGPGVVQVIVVLLLLVAGPLSFACWWSLRRECLYTTE